MEKIILFSGASAVGKTAVLRHLLSAMQASLHTPCVCKIDCLHSEDESVFKQMGVPCITGLSEDTCPDHYMVSNLSEIIRWGDLLSADTLFLETAGLCHRCSPSTEKMIAGCVIDATASSRAPKQLGPMLSEADFIVLTKTDMISQAETEILSWKIHELNPRAEIFPADALSGFGCDALFLWLQSLPGQTSWDEDILRHTMPSCVCSYCVGERRVGNAYQQGVIHKIQYQEVC